MKLIRNVMMKNSSNSKSWGFLFAMKSFTYE